LNDTTQLATHHFVSELEEDRNISHVWLIHCETTSGIVNPLADLAKAVKSRGRIFMVDAMSSFGAIDLNMVRDDIDVMVSSSNKCIEGIPGFSYVLVKKELLLAAEGQSHSVVLDLFE
jgi:2-aminoethylphosphonate-pyruvate transaminase